MNSATYQIALHCFAFIGAVVTIIAISAVIAAGGDDDE